ncbi:hypothetical protein BGZ76_009763 [Entomortierella beljakovae]|nr:hypothetical protein BGZ76_009763 [Entomortierella beljakovae]
MGGDHASLTANAQERGACKLNCQMQFAKCCYKKQQSNPKFFVTFELSTFIRLYHYRTHPTSQHLYLITKKTSSIMYTEDQVNSALAELKKHDTSTWELFTEIPNFKIYRRGVTGSSLKEYKVLGSFLDLPVKYLVLAYTDLDFRKSWDKHMAGWKQLEDDRFHYTSKFPWPLSPRDYVYQLKVQEFPGGIVCINGKSVQDKAVPEKSGTVRVDEYRQDVVIQPTEDGRGCNIWFGYFDNPKGNIPTSIINWAAKSGVPGFLTALRDAGHAQMKRDAHKAENEKTLSLPQETSSTIAVDC